MSEGSKGGTGPELYPNLPLMSLCRTPPLGCFLCLPKCDLPKHAIHTHAHPHQIKTCVQSECVFVWPTKSRWRLWCRQPTVCKEGLLTPFRIEVGLKASKVLWKKRWRKSKSEWQSKKCKNILRNQTHDTCQNFSQDLGNIILWSLGWVYWINV